MSARRYVEENGFATMLAAKRLAGVAPEINLKEFVTCIPPPNTNKAAHSGFQTQRKCHQNRGIRGPTKRTYVLQIFFKESSQSSKKLS